MKKLENKIKQNLAYLIDDLVFWEAMYEKQLEPRKIVYEQIQALKQHIDVLQEELEEQEK